MIVDSTHRIHVCYIYIYMVTFPSIYPKCYHIYHTWILWVKHDLSFRGSLDSASGVRVSEGDRFGEQPQDENPKTTTWISFGTRLVLKHDLLTNHGKSLFRTTFFPIRMPENAHSQSAMFEDTIAVAEFPENPTEFPTTAGRPVNARFIKRFSIGTACVCAFFLPRI